MTFLAYSTSIQTFLLLTKIVNETVLLLQIQHITLMLMVVVEQFPRVKRWIPALILCLCEFLALLPLRIYAKYLTILRNFALNTMRIFVILIFSFAVFIFYGANNLCDDMSFLMGKPPVAFWRYIWYMFVPLTLLLTYTTCIWIIEVHFFMKVTHILTEVYLLYGCFIGIIIIAMIIQIIRYSVQGESLNVLRPDKKWGPSDPLNMVYRHFFKPETTERYRDPAYKCTHTCLRENRGVKQIEKQLQRKREAYMKFINLKEDVPENEENKSGSQSTINNYEDQF